MPDTERFDVVVVGGTPGGCAAAIAAARRGHDAVVLDRSERVGGLPANGLGATDIGTRDATGGLFRTFVDRVYDHYVSEYGADSPQVAACDDGFHFEPSVAGRVFDAMLADHGVTVRTNRRFVADEDAVAHDAGRVAAVGATDTDADRTETYRGAVFVDATYEGDLAAAAGVPFRVGRESRDAFDEALAGKVYKTWNGPVGPGSTGEGDNAIQAYNYRLCLTDDPDNRRPIPKPEDYDRSEYASLVEDVREDRNTTTGDGPTGIDRIVNMVRLPNDKVDANNQHAAFLSTDLPEENWPWPTAFPAWRERFAARLRDYTLGLLWFAQHDPALPESFRDDCAQWGLAADEYPDTDGFPRRVYVREGRRIEGDYLFTAHDAVPAADGRRPPVHRDSVTASHYHLDSHAVRKREPGRPHLDGFFSTHESEGLSAGDLTIREPRPYTVPFRVMCPRAVEGLLAPVPASASHVGFSTLRMEPCWMAMGEAAGTAAALALEDGYAAREVPIPRLQRALLRNGAVLMHYEDVDPSHPAFAALQFLGVRGLVTDWRARLDAPIDRDTATAWTDAVGVSGPTDGTRGELLRALFDALEGDPDRAAAVDARDPALVREDPR
jgi:hypothetical protein